MRYLVREMRLEDVPQAIEIDRESFLTLWPVLPYKKDLMYNDMAHYLVACDATAAKKQRVYGVIGLWLMAGDAHIMTLGVRQAHRRQGIGESLLISAIDLTFTLKAKLMTLEVRSANEPAQALYAKYGFIQTGHRRSYYSSGEDAVIMSSDILSSNSFQDRFQQLKLAHAERWGRAFCPSPT